MNTNSSSSLKLSTIRPTWRLAESSMTMPQTPVVHAFKDIKSNNTCGTGYRAEELGSLAGSGFREGWDD
jgi:hypothetical protein